MTHKNTYKIIVGWIFLLPLVCFAQDVNQNWVKQTVYKVATGTPIANPTAAQAQVNVTYLDGLGRPVMQIANKQSNTGKDIIVPIEYDGFGRTTKQYMPYVAANGDMSYTDYNGQDINSIVAPSYSQFGSQNFYSETQYEASPLNRVLKQAAPGTTDDWAMGSGHEIKYAYQTNTDEDQVKKFKVNGSGQLSEDGFYTANELYKTIVYNENAEAEPKYDYDHATITFTNTKGQVILKRTYANSMVDGVLTENVQHDTYNVYDTYDNLAFVLPPLVTDITTQLQTLCYQYKYDNYNRLIEKKTPDKTNWENIVYDKLNRIVATGPVASPFGDGATGYMLTRYDNFSRVCYTGWYATGDSRATIQALYNGAITNVTKTLTDTTIDTKGVRYTSVNLPSNFKLLSVNYYDNYNFTGAPPTVGFTATTDFPIYYNNTTKLPKGLPTGSWVRTLSNATTAVGETSYILYDYRARAITSKAVNYMGGSTTTKTKLNFANQTLYTTTTHQRASAAMGTNANAVTTIDNYTYTDQGRLDNHTKSINGEAVHVLSKSSYNELGQLKRKGVGGKDNEQRLQQVDYAYNIRGWLTDINKMANLTNASDPQDVFAFKLNYETPDDIDKALYNGNVSEIYWRSMSDNIKRKYSFDYDKLNRLTNAVYAKPDAATPDTNAYNESMSYDKNGNIISLLRNGGQDQPINQPVAIDNLTYQYIANTNQLLTVSDTSNSTEGFKDVASLEDYVYDDFGNQTKDDNKGISLIKYNHLNLPTEIIFSTTPTVKKITYLYDASGNKLQKIVTSGTSVVTTDYIDGFQYKDAVLQFFPHAEGYVVNTQTTTINGVRVDNYNYVYNYLDHLGNVRVSYTWDIVNNGLKIIEENGYYPYGLKHSGYNGDLAGHKAVANETKVEVREIPSDGSGTVETSLNQTRFNHREWQGELGLNVTDMDFRQYNNAIGRFVCTDPITHYNQSPYHFANNNPIAYNDPTGLDYTLDWAANQAYLNSSLGSSSNWGQSAVGGNAIGFMTAFKSSVYTTSSPSDINGIIGYYARQNGYSGYSYTYSDSFNNIHGEGVGFQQYSTKGGAGIFGSLLNSISSLFDWFSDNQSGYAFNDGSMKSDFTGDKIGKNGVFYGVTQNPWAPGAEVHNFNPAPGVKASTDLFATLMELSGNLKDARDTTKAEKTRDSVTEQDILKTVNFIHYAVMNDGSHVPAENPIQLDSLRKDPNYSGVDYKGNNR